MNKLRLKAAFRASVLHLLGSVVVAVLAAGLVFGFFYPHPYAEMLGGFGLFLLVVGVDVVCGPLLTLVLFNPVKSRLELTLDLSIVVAVQVAALVYGLHTVWLARPIYLAYELDRFRVVAMADLEPDAFAQSPDSIPSPGWTGPKMLGVKVATSEDKDYLDQLQMSLGGVEVAFRPDRWRPYSEFAEQVAARASSMDKLRRKHPESQSLINDAISKAGVPEAALGWLPVQSKKSANWVAVVNIKTAEMQFFLPLDGF